VAIRLLHPFQEIISDALVSGDNVENNVVMTSVAKPITEDTLLLPPPFSLDKSSTSFSIRFAKCQ